MSIKMFLTSLKARKQLAAGQFINPGYWNNRKQKERDKAEIEITLIPQELIPNIKINPDIQ